MSFLNKIDTMEADKKLSCAQTFSKALSLFKSVFTKRDRTKEDKEFQRALQTRAWILHCGLTIVRLYSWGKGDAVWQS